MDDLREECTAERDEIQRLQRLVGLLMNDARRRLDPELKAVVDEVRLQFPTETPMFRQPEIIADLEDRLFQALVVINALRTKCDPDALMVPISSVEMLIPRDGWED